MSGSKLIVIVGTGPGIGLATATLFASRGFDVALISRSAQRLREDVAEVQSAGKGVKVRAFPVDVADYVALKKTLDSIHQKMGKPEVVVFNAARIAQTTIGETNPEDVLEDFKLTNIGQYVAASWALPLLAEVAKQEGTHPSFLLNSSGISYMPVTGMFSLSMQKAAQNNFLGSLAQVAGPKGVHVARIDINGQVADSEPVLNAKSIAEQLWELYEQDRERWAEKVNCGTMEEFIKKLSGGQ